MRIKSLAISVLIVFCLSTSPANSANVISDFFGFGISSALLKAKDSGISKEVLVTPDKAFDKTLEILKEDKLTVYKKDRKDGYIIFMNLPKQTDTTQVAAFFDPSGDYATKVTLASLSSTALKNAEGLVLEKM